MRNNNYSWDDGNGKIRECALQAVPECFHSFLLSWKCSGGAGSGLVLSLWYVDGHGDTAGMQLRFLLVGLSG